MTKTVKRRRRVDVLDEGRIAALDEPVGSTLPNSRDIP